MISTRLVAVFLFLAIIHTVKSGPIQNAPPQATEQADNLQDNIEVDDEGVERDSDINAVTLKPGSNSFREALPDLLNQVISINRPPDPEQEMESSDVVFEEEVEEEEVEEDEYAFNFTTANEMIFEPSNYGVPSAPELIANTEEIDVNDPEEIARQKKITNKDGFDAILDINSHLNVTGTFEGDMKFLRTRNAASIDGKWPKARWGRYKNLVPIPYKLDRKYSSEHVRVIRSAMASYAKHTCVRFVPRRSEIAYIYITDAKGCSSYIGKTGYSRQIVSLAIPSCITKGTVTHELMHVVGFVHEHSRSDRDKYIKILPYNVQTAELLDEFEKYNDTKNLVVYDYNSVMHYGRSAFSKQQYLPTMQIIPRRSPKQTIGQRSRMSPYDIEEIKYFYNCGPGTYQRCGKDFVNKATGSFSSPSYPSAYPAASHCTWNITVRAGRYVTVTFKKIDISDSPLCENDAVLIHDGTSAAFPVLRKICGKNSGEIQITSTGQSMFIIFSSDLIADRKTGFRAAFRESQKPGLVPKPMITPTLPDIKPMNSKLFYCNFEIGTCGMTQDSLDDLDWLTLTGETPSLSTGPSGDHTSGKGKYIYVEASDPAKPGDSAIIRTPWLGRRPGHCVSFAYHMYGRDMGSLSLFAYEKRSNDAYGHEVLLWQKMGDQGTEWLTAKVSYQPEVDVQSVQFYWEMYVSYYTSDAALDDISVTTSACLGEKAVSISPSPITTTRVSSTTKTVTTTRPSTKRTIITVEPPIKTNATLPTLVDNLNCTFENGLCGWIQSTTDHFNWSFDEDDTPSRSTGPSADHTIGVSGKGKYLFIEASYPRKFGHVARLVSPLLTPTTHCIRMWYHMYGKRIGKLKVSQIVNAFRKTVFEKSGDQGNEWQSMSVEINPGSIKKTRINPAEELLLSQDGMQDTQEKPYEEEEVRPNDDPEAAFRDDPAIFDPPGLLHYFSTVKVVIEAITSDGYAGDIAIDDVVISDGSCDSTAVGVAKPKLISKLTCSFESRSDDLCGMKQLKSDDFEWTKKSGSTPSSQTGPNNDHTKRNETGFYIYIEASGPERLPGQVAELVTPKLTPGQYCVHFYAHMFGTGMGSLLVFSNEDFGKDGSQRTRHWSILGSQSSDWFLGGFDYTSQASTRSVQFIFQGRVGPTFTSDIAIDDISITPGSCRGDVTTTIPITTNTTTPKPPTTTTTITTTTTTPTTTTTTTPKPTTTTTTPTTTTTTTPKPTTTTPSPPPTTTTPSPPPPTTTTSTTVPPTTTITPKPTTSTTTATATTPKPAITSKLVTTTSTTKLSTTILTSTTTTTTTAPVSTTTTSRTTTRSGFAVARLLTTASPAIRKTVTKSPLTAKLQLPSAFVCDFDKTGFCGMKQSTDDDFNWIRIGKETPSGKTGPAVDHTRGSPGYFMYIETSAPRRFGNKAIISTPSLGVETPKRCVTFWYHMLGSGMGTFKVLAKFSSSQSSKKISKPTVKREEIFSRSGNQGDQWKMGRVEIAQDTSFYGGSLQLQFVGIRGQTYQGDLSVDDICTAEGPCDQINRCAPSGVLRTSTVRAPITPKPVTAAVARGTTSIQIKTTTLTPTIKTTTRATTRIRGRTLNPNMPVGLKLCNFEGQRRPQIPQISLSRPTAADRARDLGKYKPSVDYTEKPMCGFTQMKAKDQFDWIRKSGSTPSGNTGPRGDHTTSRGYYVYIEASLPRKTNEIALLQTYKMYPTKYCVDLYYHMFGDFIGRLSVKSVQKLNNGRHAVVSLKNVIGNQGNSWKHLQVDYTPQINALTAAFRLEGVVGSNYRSDIAVDDVRIIPGRCDACKRPNHSYTNSLRQQQNFATGCVHPGLFWVRCCSVAQKPVIYRRVKQCNPDMFSSTMLNWLC